MITIINVIGIIPTREVGPPKFHPWSPWLAPVAGALRRHYFAQCSGPVAKVQANVTHWVTLLWWGR